jgi:hypothetical protein
MKLTKQEEEMDKESQGQLNNAKSNSNSSDFSKRVQEVDVPNFFESVCIVLDYLI